MAGRTLRRFARTPRRASGGSGSDEGTTIDPRDVDNTPADAIDPDSIGDTDAGDSGTGNDAPRRRGRKPGSKNRASKASATPSVSGIEATLLSIYQMGAAFFAIPELELQKDEARAIADALVEVNKHYPIPGIDPKHAAIATLVFVLVVTNGKRVPAIIARSKSGGKLTARESNVVPMNPPVEAKPWF